MNTKLLEVINTVLEGKGVEKITSIQQETHLRNDLGFDSFDLAELTVRLDEEFNIDVFAEGIVNTVGEIEKLIAKNAAP